MEPSETSSTPFALVFTDMVGSTVAKRAAELGETEATRDSNYLEAIQSRHLHLVRDTVATHGGKEVMTIGDSFFLTFEDPDVALLCCAEIQMRLRAQPIMTGNGPLKLRIGIHVGRPKFFENSWHGIAVDTAARAEAVGSSEQIIITDAARQHLGFFPAIKLTPLGTFALKGVGAVPLWDVDYDNHGPRKPQVPSVETLRRQHRSKLTWRVTCAVLILLILLGGFYGYRKRQTTKFTERDKVILADFDNKTGDPVFDATLKEALSIQLEQSPVLQLVGDQELHADLRYLNQPTELGITYTNAGDPEKSVDYYKQVADNEHWDIAADDNLAGELLCINRVAEAKKYIDYSASVSNGSDTPLIVNQAFYAFVTGSPIWKSYAGSTDTRQDGFLLAQAYSDLDYMQGAFSEARTFAEQGARAALASKAPDAAGNVLSTAALFEAEMGVCSEAPSLAKKALNDDASIETLPSAALSLALCGQGLPELASLRKLAKASPDNTLLNDVYLPQAEAAVALAQHRPQDVPPLLEISHPYTLASIAPILEATALLQMHRPSDVMAVLQPVLRYRYLEAQMGTNGEFPSYTMATLLAARAYAMAGDKPNATRMYQRVVDLWKNADPNFQPLASARTELAAL